MAFEVLAGVMNAVDPFVISPHFRRWILLGRPLVPWVEQSIPSRFFDRVRMYEIHTYNPKQDDGHAEVEPAQGKRISRQRLDAEDPQSAAVKVNTLSIRLLLLPRTALRMRIVTP